MPGIHGVEARMPARLCNLQALLSKQCNVKLLFMDMHTILYGLLLPLLKLVGMLCVGLFIAVFLESLHWTRFIAKLASPLVRLGHLRDIAGASFALAFFSPAASNSLLAEGLARGEITRRELVVANLFNSSPTFLVHLPTLFSLAYAFLGRAAFTYVGLTFAAAVLRTVGTVVAGRIFLPSPAEDCPACRLPEEAPRSVKGILVKVVKRFRKRLIKLLLFTIPVYCAFFYLHQAGIFDAAEGFMANHLDMLPFLKPEAVGIVALHLAAESGAAFGAAAALAASGALSTNEIIMALLVGNILSSPVRAVRHQFPSYAGFFGPASAATLVLSNQACRVVSLVVIAAMWYSWAF